MGQRKTERLVVLLYQTTIVICNVYLTIHHFSLLHSGKKSEANPHILKDDFRKMQSRYKNYQQIYTDGSKEDSKVGCAVISDNHSNMQRIPDDSSIFTAEAGNESVDQNSKDSLNLHPTNFSIPYANFKSFINRYILNKWQILWKNSVGNKLFEIKPVIGQSQPVVRNVRQEEVVLARLRIGHTRITHSYLLKREEPPYCFGCDTLFTVSHFLLECGDFSHIRNKYFHVDTIKQLFNDVPIDNVFLFLKEINLFNKL